MITVTKEKCEYKGDTFDLMHDLVTIAYTLSDLGTSEETMTAAIQIGVKLQ